ncbi:MAG: bifunctional 4-hydroxy-2-oxoglutarate aldolase/2-dehydro-3-deoxy-phosphogluconate aldolase [Candidatus Omnitrophica bacterium]|nr:bifunctional 4-hydroxy-2-oxoglutarate aldolase/2-dehydro-3-deoxy-phosphogluconate aldolase [Candidatus Omnitrophota bacterium]
MNVTRFRKLPILGILRDIPADTLEPLLLAVRAGGLHTIEITMNTQDAAVLIRKSVKLFSKEFMIGAGTVLTIKDLKSALDAGATFIVMPVLVREVMEDCVKHKIPVFPGALTPQQIYDAWQAGATMVKVFPARFFGPEYFKEIQGPFRDIELMACSGVTPKNLPEYFRNGASAVAIGSSIFRKDWIQAKSFAKITAGLKAYIRSFKTL